MPGAVLSSPKLTDSEIESFTKMGNVSEEVLRVIGNNRSWLKNYGVMLGLVRNAKTPLAISMQLIQRLNERDQKMLAVDRKERMARVSLVGPARLMPEVLPLPAHGEGAFDEGGMRVVWAEVPIAWAASAAQAVHASFMAPGTDPAPAG